MDIVNFKCESNYFTTLTLSLLKIDNHIFTDLNDLEKNISNIKSKWVILVYKNFGLTKDFVDNLEEIKNLNKNCILSSVNIFPELKNKNKKEIIDFEPFQNSSYFVDKFIFGCLVNIGQLDDLLKNKEIKTFHELTRKINFKKICLYDCLSQIKFVNNLIDDNNSLFCKNFKNKKNIENIENIKASYFSFLAKGKINSNYKNQIVKIYNEVNKFHLNNCIIDGSSKNIKEILTEYSSSPLNISYNNLYLLNYEDKDLEKFNIKSKLLNLKNDFTKNFTKILKESNLNFDFYFINSLHKMKNISSNENTSVIYNWEEGFEIIKIKCFLLKFFIIELKDFTDFIKKMGNLVLYYLEHNLYIQDDPINIIPSVKKEKFLPNVKFIDKLYEEKEYDECSFLINLIIRNRLSFNYTFIYKTLVLVDKINYVINEKELQSLVSLLKFSNFEEFFNIVVVLNYNKCRRLAYQQFDKYILENEIKKKDILKILLLSKWFSIFEREIDISRDKLVLNNILKHFNYINENLRMINDYDQQINIEKFEIEILIYLNNRFELIDDIEKKQLILEKIQKITFDFNNIDNYDEKYILNKFMSYPNLVLGGCYQLSDFLMSTEDIKNKRNSLLKLTRIIINNFSKLEEKFIKLIKENQKIELLNLFRYAYQGIPNKELFHNCVTITRKFLELKFISETKNYEEIKENEKLNLFHYKPKKTNNKKICFISDFLTRKHSVFKDRHQVIKHLIKKGFEVYIATFKPFDFKFSQTFYGIKENINLSNMTIFNMVQKIRSYNFDKLVFCEIGMDNRVTNMAHFRMANKQYNTWGHSDTSGFQEIDYFVSSELYELPYEESKLHYTEKLILQKGMCTSYINPTSCFKLNLPRSFYGLSDYEKIILCPQSLFKIHPDFDEYIFRILKENTNCSLVFLDNLEKKFKMYERWNIKLKNKKEYYGILARVKFIPGQDHQRFCNLMKCADILIDPYPFGGCNSSLESFSLFKPLVTQPSIRINGRFTYGFYKKMNMDEMIANNMEEYIDITTKLLNDKDFYDKQVNLLKERSDILFEDKETLQEWEELMSQ